MGKPQVERIKMQKLLLLSCWEIDTTTMSNTMFGFNRAFLSFIVILWQSLRQHLIVIFM